MRHRILTAICRALEGQGTDGSLLPDPWLTWLVVCLVRQISRQRWMLGVVRERLHDDESGDVPDLPGWRYEFHGQGCCLSGVGESIDVDFHEHAERTIDPYFFASRLQGLKMPGLPERRGQMLLRTGHATVLAIDELRRLGVVGHPASKHVFRLSPEFEALEERLSTAAFSGWCERIGDFEGVEGHPRSSEARHRRLDWVRSLLTGPDSHRALEALALELDDREFLAAAEGLVDGSPGPGPGTAIRELSKRPKAPFCEAVPRLLRRMKPGEDHPFSAFEAARYLLQRGREIELARRTVLDFGRTQKAPGHTGNPFAADFAVLALEFLPEHAVELVRLALRSEVPIARTTMEAALVLLDKPWTRRELERGDWKRNENGWLEYEIEKQRAWAERVRATLPDELG